MNVLVPRKGSVADNLPPVIDPHAPAQTDPVRPGWNERRQIFDLAVFPQHGMRVDVLFGGVRETDDLTAGIDAVRVAHRAAGQCSQIVQFAALPQKSMENWRVWSFTFGKPGLPDHLIAIVKRHYRAAPVTKCPQIRPAFIADVPDKRPLNLVSIMG